MSPSKCSCFHLCSFTFIVVALPKPSTIAMHSLSPASNKCAVAKSRNGKEYFDVRLLIIPLLSLDFLVPNFGLSQAVVLWGCRPSLQEIQVFSSLHLNCRKTEEPIDLGDPRLGPAALDIRALVGMFLKYNFFLCASICNYRNIGKKNKPKQTNKKS